MSEHKEINFQVQDDNGRLKDPTWRELEVKNDKCPACGQEMIVILGYVPHLKQSILYAYCIRCDKNYVRKYIGE